jgi:CRISPR-associated protein Csc1
MKIYQCDLTLHDYLFFATTERGKVAETGPFIHNYALTYALGWAVSPWHNDVQKPRYREELAQVGQKYVTPARLLRGSYLLSQYNTMSESYSLSKGRSIGYPDWGYIKCFRPGSLFRCYVISAEVVQFPHYLRLGKFMAKTSVQVTPAQQVERQASFKSQAPKRKNIAHPLLNWDDLAVSTRPIAFDIVVNVLPGHLIDNPVFGDVDAAYALATFPSEGAPVQIPLRMGYFGVNICESW